MREKKSKDFDRMMSDAIVGNVSFFAWHSVAGNMEKCELKLKAYRKEIGELEFEVTDESTDKIDHVISGTKKLNIYSPEASVSFSSEIKLVNKTENKIKIYRPLDYSFFERRKNDRIVQSAECFFTFSYNGKVFKKSIYDISPGGIAVVFSKTEKLSIPRDTEISDCTLLIKGRKLKVRAACVSMLKVDPYKHENLHYGGFKLAFRFTDMSKEDRFYLIDFVTQEALLQQSKK